MTKSRPARFSAHTGIAALTAFIFIVGLLRMMFLVIDDRIIGYANTWDMYRIQDCMSIAPMNVARVIATPEKTLQYYLANVKINDSYCLPSSELVLLFPARLILSGLFLDVFDLRLVGVIQAILISIFSMAGAYLLARHKAYPAAVFVAVVYTVILTDPVNSLYLNTFYTEPAALAFLFLSLLLGFYLLSKPPASRLSTMAGYVAFSVSLFLLGLAKFQYAVFPFFIGLAFSLAMIKKYRAGRLLFVTSLAAALACLAVSLYIYNQPTRAATPVRRANATDTIAGAVLPLARDPDGALSILNLPSGCKGMIGKDYYSEGVQKQNPCPALWQQGYTRLPLLLAQDPAIGFRMVRQSLRVFAEQARQGAVLSYLGQDKQGAQRLAASWGYAFSSLNETGWGIFISLPLPIMIVSMTGFLSAIRKPRGSPFYLASFLLSAGFYLVYFSSLFGDGWHEFIKHNWMAFNLFAALILLWAGRGIWLAIRRLPGLSA